MIATEVLVSQKHESSPWLTVPQAAELLGVSQDTIRRRIRDGSLVAYQTKRENGAYRIRRSDAEAHLEDMRVQPQEQE